MTTLFIQVKEYFHKAGIHSTTIQLEYGSEVKRFEHSKNIFFYSYKSYNSPEGCRLLCPKKSMSSGGELSLTCIENSCCRDLRERVNKGMVEDLDRVITRL